MFCPRQRVGRKRIQVSPGALILAGAEELRHQQWLQQQGGDYLVTGSVEEWRYKSGLDGEPAVGLSLKITSLSDNRIVWSGSASRSGWPRESLSGTAQKVIQQLTDDIDW